MSEEKIELPGQTGKSGNLKALWADSRARTVILLFGIIGIVVMAFAFSGGSRNNNKEVIAAKAAPAAAPRGGGGEPAEINQRYRDLVEQNNDKRATDAAQSPTQTVLPKIAGLSDPEKKAAEEPQKGPGPISTAPQMAQPVQPQSQATRGGYAGDQAYQNALRFFSDQIDKNVAPNKHAVIAAPADQNRNNPPPVTVPGGQPGSGGAQTPAQQRVVVQAGTIAYATLDVSVNSDFSGPVIATLHDGPLKGSKLIGQKTLEREMLVVKFNRISRPGGAALQADAYAVNINDAERFGETGMRTDIDRHFFTRYVLPGAAAFLRGVGEAISRTGSTSTTGVLGTTTTTGTLNTSQQVKVGIGEVGRTVADDLAKNRSQGPTVKMAANTEIGVVFAADVTEK